MDVEQKHVECWQFPDLTAQCKHIWKTHDGGSDPEGAGYTGQITWLNASSPLSIVLIKAGTTQQKHPSEKVSFHPRNSTFRALSWWPQILLHGQPGRGWSHGSEWLLCAHSMHMSVQEVPTINETHALLNNGILWSLGLWKATIISQSCQHGH